MPLTRRTFTNLVGVLGASAFLTSYKPEVVGAIEDAAADGVELVWLQGLSDSACTVSLLQGSEPDIYDAIEELRVSIGFHTTLMPEFGHAAIETLDEIEPDVLVVEGSIPTGDMEMACTVGEREGEPVTVADWVRELSGRTTTAVVGFGSCAAFGGIPGGSDFTGQSPTNAVGLHQFFDDEPDPEVPVINLSGCPGHPDWLLTVLTGLLLGADIRTDSLGRPELFYSQTVHDNCARRGAYDKGQFATDFEETDFSHEKCLLEVGCEGPNTYAACSRTLWNGGMSVCMNSGAPCIGCMHPNFPDVSSPFYENKGHLMIDGTETLFKTLTGAVLAGGAAYIGLDLYKEWKRDEDLPDASGKSGGEES